MLLTKEGFSEEIERFHLNKKCDIVEAIFNTASKYHMEIEAIPKFLTPRIKTLLEVDARSRKLLKAAEYAQLDYDF